MEKIISALEIAGFTYAVTLAASMLMGVIILLLRKITSSRE
ncbi:MAG: hypothetical protein QME78_11740 [Thermodesulfobacteriota bacterium]|nr:hypothetical protein [Thermodesulfobacteriota bacterium]